MKTRIRLTILVGLAFMVAVLVAAQTSGNTTAADTTQQTASTNTVMPMANMQDHSSEHVNKMHAMHALSADEAYKQNCTRCHSEVPQANARTTKTVLRHMRVRANITQDEAKAILEYLTQ